MAKSNYNYSFVVTWTYFSLYMFIFLIVSVVCAFAVHTECSASDHKNKWTAKEIVRMWSKLLWKKKKVYGQLIPHFFDQATDLGVIFEYYKLRDTEEGINTMYLFITSICVLVFHRIISSAAIYHLTKKPIYILYQIFDLLMVRCIWTNYKLHSDEPSNSQRYLQIMEATFESAPQILISTAFLVKATTEYNPIVIISLITSFWTLSARVSADDKLMFKDEWKRIRCKARCPCVNYRYIIRVFLWRFLEISSRIILLCLMWINLGGISVFIVLAVEFVYLSVICFDLESVEIMGNIIYLVAANSNKKSEQRGMTMTRIYWCYRVISSYLYLILVTIFTMTKFDSDLRKVNDYETRHGQTIENDVGFAIFVYCWIVTPIWQWVGAVIVFDFGNISSVARDVDHLIADGKVLDVLELISFGATFNAQVTLREIVQKKNEIQLDLVENQIAEISLDQLQNQNKVKNAFFIAALDGEHMVVQYLLDKKAINVDVRDDEHRTALYYAAARNHIRVVSTLLDNKADCTIIDQIDEKDSSLNNFDDNNYNKMNVLQCKLKETQFPCNDKHDLVTIKVLVYNGNFNIDLRTYNIAKEAGHSLAVLTYLNEKGNLEQNVELDVNSRPSKASKPEPEQADANKNATYETAQWIKDRNRSDRPIMDYTLYVVIPFFLAPLAFVMVIIGADIAALVINFQNDCNAALVNGSRFVSFDLDDFILGGCISHVVVSVLLLCVVCIVVVILGEAIDDYHGWFALCGGGSLCCFVGWIVSWSAIGFLLYSEMDKTLPLNKQCADAVLWWSVCNCIQLLLSPLFGYCTYAIIMCGTENK